MSSIEGCSAPLAQVAGILPCEEICTLRAASLRAERNASTVANYLQSYDWTNESFGKKGRYAQDNSFFVFDIAFDTSVETSKTILERHRRSVTKEYEARVTDEQKFRAGLIGRCAILGNAEPESTHKSDNMFKRILRRIMPVKISC